MDLHQETLAFEEGFMLHHDKRRHKQFKIVCFFHFPKNNVPKKKGFFPILESSDSRCKVTWNGRPHHVPMAKKWSWLQSDGPKVPKNAEK